MSSGRRLLDAARARASRVVRRAPRQPSPAPSRVDAGLRTGIDLVTVADVADALAAHGSRYVDRVYTPGEQQDCRRGDGTFDVERLAARFAAKEAATKVLRPGRDVAVPWTSIELVRADAGATTLRWTGAAEDLATAAGLHDVAVSVTHDHGTAASVVVARAGVSRTAPTPLRHGSPLT
jgi:holo-[acyl-carrier protein] synthase